MGSSRYISSYFIIYFCIFHFKIHQNTFHYSPCCCKLSTPQSTRIAQRLFLAQSPRYHPLSCRESFSMMSCLHCWTICLTFHSREFLCGKGACPDKATGLATECFVFAIFNVCIIAILQQLCSSHNETVAPCSNL